MANVRWQNSSVDSAYTYNSWTHMRDRCYNPQADQYAFYGERGIIVCERWRNDYDAFVEYMGIRPFGLTIERIGSNGNYEPGNCRWATRSEQARNRKSNRIIEFRGVSKPLFEWAETLGVSADNFRQYLKRHSVAGAIQRLISRMEF